MKDISSFKAVWTADQLGAESMEMDDLFSHVMDNGVAILRNVFPKEKLSSVRTAVHDWGSKTPAAAPQTYIDENYHAIEAGISPRQKTPHAYHAYNFNYLDRLPSDLSQKLLGIFNPLMSFQNRLTKNAAAYEKCSDNRKLHPQIIHYPSGGGMFGKHTHPLEPQRIGLILGLSERGVDFHRGSTHFEVDGNDIGTDEAHNIGDLILFRFDIPHWITAIDEGSYFDTASSKGRWTAVLPYY